MQSLGSVASIVAAIREDASAEADRLDEATAKEIEAIRAEGTAASVAVPDRQARIAAARAENEERVARQEWEGRRRTIEQREAWIERVTAAARTSWHADRAQLTALIREALETIDAAEVEIAVAENDRPMVDAKKLGRKVRLTSAAIGGGCIVTGGNLVFDNSFEARARRLEAVWRKALSGVYNP